MKYFNIGKEVLKKLQSNGYEAYFVGGFVRDKLLGNFSDDIDITTNALPNEVEELFDNVKQTGKKYGTVTILIDSFKYEVTTFRFDGEYLDGRRPDKVSFSSNLEDDLERRDFTINALVMNADEEVKDYHNGLHDLEDKIIRTIDDPLRRFQEDALRMLRAIRFVSKLGFEIETDTLNAIKELRHLIHNVSIERVMVEISKIFKGKHRQKAVQYLVKSKLHEELFGLQKGMEYIQHIETEVKPLEAFMISFILDEFNETWKFSNTNRRVIEKVMQLHEVTKEGIWNKFIVFSNKKDICLLTNRINVFLGYKDQSDLINEIDDGLIVKDVCGLAFKGQDILQLTTLKKRSVIALVIDDLLFNVIMEIMPNDYDILKEFALKRVEELQKELER